MGIGQFRIGSTGYAAQWGRVTQFGVGWVGSK